MRILICDDSLEDVRTLKTMIVRYLRREPEELVIYNSGEELLKGEEKHDFTLLFLDIYMKEMDGIRTAQKLRSRGKKGAIILTSCSSAFGPQSYEVGAAWYLTKPFTYEVLARAFARGLLCAGEEVPQLKLLKNGSEICVPVDSIDYIETEGRRVAVHMGPETLRVYDSLERLYRLLGEAKFIRPHRSYILHMDFISGMEEGQFCLCNGERVSISRRNRKKIREIYQNYLFRKVIGGG